LTQFICATQDLAKTTEKVTEPGLCRELLTSELVYLPKEPVHDLSEDLEAKVAGLIDSLEDNEDILRVYTTLD
jgi:translational activator of cytochrome c oxidase 1